MRRKQQPDQRITALYARLSRDDEKDGISGSIQNQGYMLKFLCQNRQEQGTPSLKTALPCNFAQPVDAFDDESIPGFQFSYQPPVAGALRVLTALSLIN